MGQTVFTSDTKSNHSQSFLFKQLAHDISELGAEIGAQINPFCEENFPYFSRIDTAKKDFNFRDMATHLTICQPTLQEGSSLNVIPRLSLVRAESI